MLKKAWYPAVYTWPAHNSLPKPAAPPKYHKIALAADKGGITHLQLARPPVNSLNREVLTELNQLLLWLGTHDESRAVVISSANPGIFSAGLDLQELLRPTRESFRAFWASLLEMWRLMNTFPKPLVSAVNGNSPAGGCIIALATDVRVMAKLKAGGNGKPFAIGLNEAQLGLTAPPWAADAYSYVLGARVSERLLQTGELVPAEDALRLGLVDFLTPDDTTCVDVAFKEAEKLLAVPPAARSLARDLGRHAHLRHVATPEARELDTEVMMDLIMADQLQADLDAYVTRLRQRSKK